MAVKSTVNEAPKQAERPFPKLMKSNLGTSLIVFFDEYEIGQVVAGDESLKLGHSSTLWDMDTFEDFTGSVTLQNEDWPCPPRSSKYPQ